MDPDPAPPRSLVSSVRDLSGNLVATAHDRIELLSLELQEEKFRLLQSVIWVFGAAFTAMMTVIFGSLAILYTCWESDHIAVLGLFTLFYGGVTAAVVTGFRRFLARQPKPLAATLEELTEDEACIRKEN